MQLFLIGSLAYVFRLREDSLYTPLESFDSEDSIPHGNIGMKSFGSSNKKFVLEENDDENSIGDIKYELESVDSE